MTPPTVGRIVHYYGHNVSERSDDTGPFAAIVLDVENVAGGPYACTLKVFARDGIEYQRPNVPYDESMSLDSWSWPPRVA